MNAKQQLIMRTLTELFDKENRLETRVTKCNEEIAELGAKVTTLKQLEQELSAAKIELSKYKVFELKMKQLKELL